jgi:hypothetical protein
MTANMIFTDEIHDDFKKMQTIYPNETIPLWTPEKGYLNENEDYPARANRNYSLSYYPTLDKIDKENICALRAFRIFFHKPNEILTPYHPSIFMSYEEYLDFNIYPKSYKTDLALKVNFLRDR